MIKTGSNYKETIKNYRSDRRNGKKSYIVYQIFNIINNNFKKNNNYVNCLFKNVGPVTFHFNTITAVTADVVAYNILAEEIKNKMISVKEKYPDKTEDEQLSIAKNMLVEEKYDTYIENLCDEAEVDWGIYDEYENKTTSTQIYNFDGILN